MDAPTYSLIEHADGTTSLYCVVCKRVTRNDTDVRDRWCCHCGTFHGPQVSPSDDRPDLSDQLTLIGAAGVLVLAIIVLLFLLH